MGYCPIHKQKFMRHVKKCPICRGERMGLYSEDNPNGQYEMVKTVKDGITYGIPKRRLKHPEIFD